MNEDIPQTVTAPIEEGDTPDEYRDRQIGVLMAHMRHHSAQSAELVVAQHLMTRNLTKIEDMLAEHVKASEGWRTLAHERMDELAAGLKANTEITDGVRNAVNAGKIGASFLKWLGIVAVGLGSIWWGIREIFGQHQGPGISP